MTHRNGGYISLSSNFSCSQFACQELLKTFDSSKAIATAKVSQSLVIKNIF